MIRELACAKCACTAADIVYFVTASRAKAGFVFGRPVWQLRVCESCYAELREHIDMYVEIK